MSKSNWELEREVFGDFPLDYDNITAEAAERTNKAHQEKLGSRAWDLVIDEILILAKETLNE